MSQLSVVALQLEASNRNNLDQVLAEIEGVAREHPAADLVVVGELASYGSRPDAAQPRAGEAEQAFQALAAKHGIWLVPGSLFESDREAVYNMAPVIDPRGEIVDRYRKMFPFVPYEKATSPGERFVVFDVPGIGRIGLCICYDIWFPEVARTLAWMGAELILCPTMTNTIDREVELCLARATAAVNQCYVLSVNVAGELGVGQSIAVDPDGTVIHQAGGDREIFTIDVDFEQVRRSRDVGVLGLCQVLKSFRDRSAQFPPYAPDAGPGSLEVLGPLRSAGKDEVTKF